MSDDGGVTNAELPKPPGRCASSLARLREVVAFRLGQLLAPGTPSASPTEATFCIAHFNAPVFLEATLTAIQQHQPGSRILVSDASSSWPEFCAAREVAQKLGVEFHPLTGRHRHTGLLNYMFSCVRSPIAVFLDQDCVLLGSLEGLFQEIRRGQWLAGPRDEMFLDHPRFVAHAPKMKGFRFRVAPQFVHASLLVANVPEIRARSGDRPFRWQDSWGPHPLERYYGISQLVLAENPSKITFAESRHTAYGLGQAYYYQQQLIAYHNWYSGQVYGQQGKMDGLFEVDWLKGESKRFLEDWRKEKLMLLENR
jgi:hypothetical protein